MNQPNRGQQPWLSASDKSGYIMIVTVIVIAAIMSVVIVETSLAAISQLESVRVGLQGTSARLHTEACLEEAMIQLNRDDEYASETFSLGSGSCDVVISGAGNSRDIQVIGQINNYSQTLEAEVAINPFVLISWDN